jgi:tRNA (guanine9-N1)-methyltransferase
MAKTIKQILRVYTENRRAEAPMQLYLTSFKDKCKSEMAKHHGYENWDINFHSEDYLDMFPKEKLIYLSSESDKVITELQQDKVYIIGGLVDHNFHKVE